MTNDYEIDNPSFLGWIEGFSYQYKIIHRPCSGIINVKIWKADVLIVETGDIIDDDADRLLGGRLGVFCNSQEDITWSNMNYKCLETKDPQKCRARSLITP